MDRCSVGARELRTSDCSRKTNLGEGCGGMIRINKVKGTWEDAGTTALHFQGTERRIVPWGGGGLYRLRQERKRGVTHVRGSCMVFRFVSFS